MSTEIYTDSHREDNQQGAVAALAAILLFLILAVGAVAGAVIGLDAMVGKDDPEQSLFSDNAKIKPILKDLREKKQELAATIEQRLEQAEAAARHTAAALETEQAHDVGSNVDVELDNGRQLEDIEKRLGSSRARLDNK